MKADTHFWSHVAEFYIEWEIFQKKKLEKIKTNFFWFNKIFFFENGVFCELM